MRQSTWTSSSRSLSDLGIVGCETASAVHFLPAFCPIAGLWACKSGENCPRWGRFSLSTPQARQAPRPRRRTPGCGRTSTRLAGSRARARSWCDRITSWSTASPAMWSRCCEYSTQRSSGHDKTVQQASAHRAGRAHRRSQAAGLEASCQRRPGGRLSRTVHQCRRRPVLRPSSASWGGPTAL